MMTRNGLLMAVGCVVAMPVVLGTSSAAGTASNAPPDEKMIDFDKDKAGSLPAGWKAEGTAQKGPVATWQVVADTNAPSKPNVLALTRTNHTSGDTFNICWTDQVKFKEGTSEVSFKPVSGKEDQGGGPIWRVKDKDNYYICRANPLESNFRVYYVKGGTRTQLASEKVEIAAGQWHTIKVTQTGDKIECWLDGKTKLEAKDTTLPDEGGVGVWTKSDAVTSFDDLKIKPAAEAPKKGTPEKKPAEGKDKKGG